MERNDLIHSIELIFKECLEIVRLKNTDYGGLSDPWKNFRSSELIGVDIPRAILVRVMDKMTRIGNLLGREGHIGAVADEKIEDTCADAINYIALLLSYLKTKT